MFFHVEARDVGITITESPQEIDGACDVACDDYHEEQEIQNI